MTITARHALITGGSRGIGRGIALKLAEHGVHVAINYLRDEASAKKTLEQVRARGSDGFTVQADVSSLDIFVSNARGDVGTFFEPAMTIGLEKWDSAMDSQAKSFLVAMQQGEKLLANGGRVIAITYSPGVSSGSWQSWVAMGAAKSALEVLCRYFAVAFAPRGITVNAISPGWIDDSVLTTLPGPVQQMIREHQEIGWTPMRRLGTPADIGNAVALMCAKEAGWITGQVVAADGGASLMSPALPLAIQQPELATA
jgi:NAD(P)-dependent dehydrogenase (short-subunit alcohol dehydrogenase family)